MTETTQLVDSIVRGIQEKKGFDIITANLTSIGTAPAQYFVICTGNNPQQVEAIAESVADTSRKEMGEKPASVQGEQQAEWIALDYGTVMVHVFVPSARQYYDLENLWEDSESELTEIPNLD